MGTRVFYARMRSPPSAKRPTEARPVVWLSACHALQSIRSIKVEVMSRRDVEASLLKEVAQLRASLDASRREACGRVSMMDAANAAAVGILVNVPVLSAVHNLRAHTGRIRTCTWVASDENLLSVGADNYICIWDVRSGLIRNIIDITMNQATAADSTPDLGVIFAGGLYANVEAFVHQPRPPEDGYSEYISSAVFEHGGRINCITYLEGHKLLTAASVDGVVAWDVNNVKVLNKCSHTTDVSAVLPLSPVGQSFVSGAADGVPRIWDMRQSRPFVCSMYGHESEISCIERHANEHTFVTGSDDAVVNLYDVRLDFPLASYNRNHAKSTAGDEFTTDGNKYSNHSGMDAEGNDQVTNEDAAITGVTGVGVSTSGRIIISGSRNGCIYIWDIFDLMSPVGVHREQGPVMALKMAHNRRGLAIITWGPTTLENAFAKVPAAMVLVFFLLVATSSQVAAPPWPPKVGTYEQAVSHFDFHFHPITFNQRFVYEDLWHKPGGPIFFYCGNEGNIMEFWNNTGFMFDIAPMFNALIVFAEHRYYGESTPFPNSFVQPYIGFLSIQEAMADFADLISMLKVSFNATASPVIAFGGSYGGMLAAYMRLRYPHIITGAIAASAPFKWVSGEEGLHPFFEAIKEVYFSANESCVTIIQAAYSEILKRSQEGISGLKNVTTELNLCTLLATEQDLDWMLRWSRNAFVVMSMMNYPYANYHLPANPVNISCNKAIEFGTQNPLAGLREAIGVFYDLNSGSCFDYKSQYIDCADVTGCGLGNDSIAWDFQACTEIHLYDPSNATSNDLFPSLPKSLTDVNVYCFKKYGVRLSEKQLLTAFGPVSNWKTASNIVFSNGNLDPWMKGGILDDVSKSVIALQIKGGAHHLDLRGSNSADPPSVKVARQEEIEAISGWLEEYRNSHHAD
ncbi:hypothetical protein TcWFU_006334 [Taenia crassiceps]|uniref:Lysosomal Pro-X carboxypeptidase n=1 Tax=Taenia crassiceps TaxID=6207 RepID=A0ABR4QE68_9CEST